MTSRVFIHVLPSPVLCSGNPTKWESFDVEFKDKIRVYPAFASEGPGRPLHPTVNVLEALKRIPSNGGNLNGLPPKRNVPYLSVEPTNESKITLIPVDAKSDDELTIYPADTVAYEIFEKKDARIHYEEAMCNLRRFTRQVWIGRAATYTNPTTSCAFEFTEKRKGHSAVFTIGPISLGYKSIRLCTEEIWREAWRLAMAPS